MTNTAEDLISTASAIGPMWQDLTIVEGICQLAVAHDKDITMERETQDGILVVKVKGR